MAKHLSDEEKQMWKQYSHERARIRQAIRREMKKGSILTIEDIIPKKPTDIVETSITSVNKNDNALFVVFFINVISIYKFLSGHYK